MISWPEGGRGGDHERNATSTRARGRQLGARREGILNARGGSRTRARLALTIGDFYLDIVLTDLQREFELARSHSLHVAPPPRTPPSSVRTGFGGLIESLLTAQHVIEMYRRAISDGTARHSLERLVNRLAKILAEVRKLETP